MKPRDYRELPDIKDDAAKQHLAEEYVRLLISEGNSPLGSIGKLTPDAWANTPANVFEQLSIAFNQTPPSDPDRDKALSSFYGAVEYALKNNPQTFQKIVSSRGESAIDKILSEYAASHPGSYASLKDMIDAAKVPKAPPSPVRTAPGAVLARDAAGNWASMNPITPEQQALFHATDGDIMNEAAANNGWVQWATNKPEEVMFLAQHRDDLPAVQAAAKGALAQAGHVVP